jgi:hypothetical protein
MTGPGKTQHIERAFEEAIDQTTFDERAKTSGMRSRRWAPTSGFTIDLHRRPSAHFSGHAAT